MAKRQPITVYVDEHISSAMSEHLRRQGMRVKEIPKTRLAGQDEHGYFLGLAAENAIFVTGDERFCHNLISAGKKKAPTVVFLHQQLDDDMRRYYGTYISAWIRRSLRDSSMALRGEIHYAGPDGMRYKKGPHDNLLISWDEIAIREELLERQH